MHARHLLLPDISRIAIIINSLTVTLSLVAARQNTGSLHAVNDSDSIDHRISASFPVRHSHPRRQTNRFLFEQVNNTGLFTIWRQIDVTIRYWTWRNACVRCGELVKSFAMFFSPVQLVIRGYLVYTLSFCDNAICWQVKRRDLISPRRRSLYCFSVLLSIILVSRSYRCRRKCLTKI